jgi:phage tail sheath protein FI
MAVYQTPGVYVEWLDRNPQQIVLRRTDVAGFVGIAERGPVQRPIKIESNRQFFTTFGDARRDSYLAYAVAGFFENGGRTCWVVRVADETARAASVRVFVAGHAPFVLQATSPGAWGKRIEIEAVWGRDAIVGLVARLPDRMPQAIDLTVAAPPDPAQPHTNLLGIADVDLPDLSPDALVVRRADVPGLPSRELSAGTRVIRLEGGSDGLSQLQVRHLTGHPDREATWGVAELERIDSVSFVAVPDLMASRPPRGDAAFRGFSDEEIADAQMQIIASCARQHDRLAILDAPPGNVPAVLAHRGTLPESSYAALYHPWIVVSDPLRERGLVRAVPPSGHVAGMFARTDRLRGVHKPPANEVLEGVADLTDLVDDDAHAALNEASINAVRPVPGRGMLVLGARTLSRDIRWRYVNVRRLFAMIEEALDEQMQWAVFEPNSPRLWREIDRAVRGFLERLYRAGMLDGQTSEQAYYVRCDDATNPASDTDLGRVTCVVGLQPPYPAEFVIVRIGVTRSSIQIEEKGSQDV